MPENRQNPDRLRAIKRDLANRLFAEFPNLVTGMAIGTQQAEKERRREILVFVEPAADCELQALREAVQKAAPGQARILPTSLFYGLSSPSERGSISFYAPTRFNVPQVSVGTLGAVVEASGKKYLLASNHTIAHNGRVPSGKEIILPSTLDMSIIGAAKNRAKHAAALRDRTIARLTSFGELQPVAWPPPPPPAPGAPLGAARPGPANTVDAALAELTKKGVSTLSNLIAVPQLAGPVSQIPLPTPVKKTGRTTGTTHSELCIEDWEGYIDLATGSYYFEGLVAAVGKELPVGSAFAGKGDSGALVVTNPAGAGVGLVTARAFNPLPGPYHGYIVLVCPLDVTLAEFAPIIGKTQIKLWRLPEK
jgi:hypothetical protein